MVPQKKRGKMVSFCLKIKEFFIWLISLPFKLSPVRYSHIKPWSGVDRAWIWGPQQHFVPKAWWQQWGNGGQQWKYYTILDIKDQNVPKFINCSSVMLQTSNQEGHIFFIHISCIFSLHAIRFHKILKTLLQAVAY